MKRLMSVILVACLLVTCSPLVFAKDYVLGPYDTLEIEVSNFQNIKTKTTVTPDGQISLPFLGFFTIQGETLKELYADLSERYGKIVKDPTITINLTPKPIYIIQHDLKKNDWDVKTAKSIDEAKAFAGLTQLPSMEHGGVYKVDSGKQPDWWEDNWYKVLTGTAVIVGIANVTRKW